MPEENKEKLPPQDIEAEKSLLGCLMIDPKAILKVVDFLLPRDFYQEKHRAIYETVMELFEERSGIDVLSVSSRLKEKNKLDEIGGVSYLTELVNIVPTASHIANYAKIVQQKRILRDLISAGYDIGELAQQETTDIEMLLDQAEKRIFSIAQKSLTQSFAPIKDSLEETWKRIDELSKHKGGLRGIPTGFKSLDSILSGFQKSDLIILAARPSLGKSSMAINIAQHVACEHKIPVGLFSLEMSKDQIIDRLLSSMGNVDSWKLRTGKLSDEGENNDFDRIQGAMSELSSAPIYINDTSGINTLQIRAMSRRLFADKPIGLLIIDYLQLMEHRNPNLSLVQQVTENSRSLKVLARELNVPVLVLSQLSRSVEQRTPPIPRLSDLRDSGCLTGDTLITKADTGERIPIKNLVGKKNILVHSLDKNLQIKKEKISKVFYSGKKMVYELKTRSGLTIKASGNHPFRKVDGWKKLDELKVNDYIATPNKLTITHPKNEISKNEIILIAHLLGDGCVLPRQPIHYTSSDMANIDIVAKVAMKLFKIQPRIVKQKNWWHVYLPSPYRLARGKYHPITNLYKSLGIKRVHSWKKEIPQAIFSLSQDNLALFLKHFWATDGNISRRLDKGKSPSASIYYSTTSLKMANAVKTLLIRFGIRSRISNIKKENYRICYHVVIQGKKHQLQFLQKIGCFGERGNIIPELIEHLNQIKSNTNLDIWPKDTWQYIINPIRQEKNYSQRAFSSGIGVAYSGTCLFKCGIGIGRLNRIATFLQSPVIENMVQSNIFWDKIISIKPLGVEKVYDATVPKTNNFVANEIIVHNSIEQDADVVAFISREDRYKENTDRQNIADIIIAKHRNGPVGKIELFFDEARMTFRDLETKY